MSMHSFDRDNHPYSSSKNCDSTSLHHISANLPDLTYFRVAPSDKTLTSQPYSLDYLSHTLDDLTTSSLALETSRLIRTHTLECASVLVVVQIQPEPDV